MDSKSLKVYGSVLSTVFGIVISILDAYEKLGKVVPGLGNYAAPLIVSLLLAVAVALQWERITYSLVRYPTASRLALWGLAVIASVFVAAGHFHLSWADLVQIEMLVSLLVVGVTVIQRYSLESGATTQYLGQFPTNLPTIIEIVRGANASIKVLTDVFAYGAYSDTRNYNRLLAALESRRDIGKVSITWCVYTEEQAKESVKKQLRLNKLTEGSEQADEFLGSEEMNAFISTFPGLKKPRTLAEFIDIVLVGRNKDAQDRLSTIGCKMQQSVTAELPLYMWVVDNRVAVFSIQVKEQGIVREDVFLTRDPALLAGLEDVGNVYWKRL